MYLTFQLWWEMENSCVVKVSVLILRLKCWISIIIFGVTIQGADIVLGIQWLRTLAKVTTDFSIPSMSFHHKDCLVSLRGDARLSSASFHQFTRIAQTDSILSLHTVLWTHPTLQEICEIATDVRDGKLIRPQIISGRWNWRRTRDGNLIRHQIISRRRNWRRTRDENV